jgi:prepilin-type processing-associated H-X9-DG protein
MMSKASVVWGRFLLETNTYLKQSECKYMNSTWYMPQRFTCPNVMRSAIAVENYIPYVNSYGIRMDDPRYTAGNGYLPLNYVKFNYVKNPSAFPHIGESIKVSTRVPDSYLYLYKDSNQVLWMRHNKKANALFLDGHVAGNGLESVMTAGNGIPVNFYLDADGM